MRFLVALLFMTASIFATKLTIMTEDWVPYNYIKDGKAKGISVEVVKAVQKKVGNSDPIDVHSWNRAYQMALSEPNTLLFLMNRTPERENLFKWAGPIASNDTYFFKRTDNPLEIKSLEDAKKVKLIGAGAETNVDFIVLKSKGFTNLSTLDTQSNPIVLIINKRVELGGSNPLTAFFNLKKNGYPLDVVANTGVKVFSADLYIAFSKGTDDAIVLKWQKALDELRESGELQKISNTALKEAYSDFGIDIK